MSLKVLIIGGVATGPKAAARLRRLDPNAKITLIERQDVLSYAGCGMPYYIEDTIKDYNQLLGGSTIRDPEYFDKNKGFTVYDQTEATKINRLKKTVTVKDLKTGRTRNIPYDKLVLATGASPFIPRMMGTELNGVHRLYNPHHAERIKTAVGLCRKVSIVGGGLIGMETCGAFIKSGCDTTVIEMMPTLVPNLLDEEMALLLENYLQSNGAKIVKGNPVAKIISDGEGNAAGVETTDGHLIQSDMVILAIGVRPNTELAVDIGLEIGSTGAIVVNEYMQTSDPDIYAGGDCVECTHIITGEKVFAPLGSTANKHGRIIADNIAGMEMKFPGVGGTAVFKVLDWNCGTTGLTEKKSRELGYDVVTTITPQSDYSDYIPEAKQIIIKLIADKKTCKLLGCQVLGEGDGIKRIDIAATAIKFDSNVKGIADIDLGYAPAYSTAIDAIAHAANTIRNKIHGLSHGINPIEMKQKLDSSEDFILLDVRRIDELKKVSFKDKRVVNIPIVELKSRVIELSRKKEIIVSCAVGFRAYNGERILRGLGFDNVKYLDGSIMAWPYPGYLT
jgi:NADPH-dependent 2,4-dienoyl-CoA reductase/sulfur reductase-like enzyme/rhodanese-related sulfurtransferase